MLTIYIPLFLTIPMAVCNYNLQFSDKSVWQIKLSSLRRFFLINKDMASVKDNWSDKDLLSGKMLFY